MKKLILVLVAVMMVIMASPISAEDKTSTVKYEVTEEYEWQVHDGIDFGQNAGPLGQTVDKDALISSQTNGVAVLKNRIAENKKLSIKISSQNNFHVVSGGQSLAYTVSKGATAGTALANGDEVLAVLAGTNTGAQPLHFQLTTTSNTAEVVGVYNDSLTYTAAIENVQ